jgi:cytoskeletal protein CcmA (bactofilin family)
LTFKGGELSSDEDLLIEGTVEGSIAHQSHQLTVGKSGRVKANVRARIIIVEGTIEGDLQGDEAVHIRKTAHVHGNVTSPRISVEEGASFDGVLKTSQGTRVGPGSAQERDSTPDLADIGIRAKR